MEGAPERAWHETARWWQSCVFPVRNSPYISVMEPVSRPPGADCERFERLEWPGALPEGRNPGPGRTPEEVVERSRPRRDEHLLTLAQLDARRRREARRDELASCEDEDGGERSGGEVLGAATLLCPQVELAMRPAAHQPAGSSRSWRRKAL